MNRTMPASVQPKRRFFSAVLYGTGHADRERPAQEQGGDGTAGASPRSWAGCRIRGYPDARTQLNIWPPCALNTTGSAKQAMRAKTAHTEAPASHAASSGSPPRSVSEVFIKPSALRCMERLLGEGGGAFGGKGPLLPKLPAQLAPIPFPSGDVRFYRALMPISLRKWKCGVGVRFFGGEKGTPTPVCTRPGTTVHQGMNVLMDMKGEGRLVPPRASWQGGYCLPVGI